MTGDAGSPIETFVHRGWELVRLASPNVAVTVVPGKGGDILSATWLPLDLDVLWKSPWGLRARGSAGTAAGSVAGWLEAYPGGWQTIFPNGGEPAVLGGVLQGFHGEACLAPWDWQRTSATKVDMETRLVRSPFRLGKAIELDGDSILVTERATNEGGAAQDVMWSHHPAFGTPFLAPGCRIISNATTFVADDERDEATTELACGVPTAWPSAVSTRGEQVDLGTVPPAGSATERFGYMGGFPDDARVSIVNPQLRLTATLSWDAMLMPHAWYWLEAGASEGFPWYGNTYVLAIEPATTVPGQGLAKALQKGGTLLRLEPGQTRTARIRLALSSNASGLASGSLMR